MKRILTGFLMFICIFSVVGCNLSEEDKIMEYVKKEINYREEEGYINLKQLTEQDKESIEYRLKKFKTQEIEKYNRSDRAAYDSYEIIENKYIIINKSIWWDEDDTVLDMRTVAAIYLGFLDEYFKDMDYRDNVIIILRDGNDETEDGNGKIKFVSNLDYVNYNYVTVGKGMDAHGELADREEKQEFLYIDKDIKEQEKTEPTQKEIENKE